MMEYIAIAIIVIIWALSLKNGFILKSLLHIVISLFLFMKGLYVLSIVTLIFGMSFEMLLLHSNEKRNEFSYNKKDKYIKIINILVITAIISFMLIFKGSLSVGEKIISNNKIIIPFFIFLFSMFLTQRRKQ